MLGLRANFQTFGFLGSTASEPRTTIHQHMGPRGPLPQDLTLPALCGGEFVPVHQARPPVTLTSVLRPRGHRSSLASGWGPIPCARPSPGRAGEGSRRPRTPASARPGLCAGSASPRRGPPPAGPRAPARTRRPLHVRAARALAPPTLRGHARSPAGPAPRRPAPRPPRPRSPRPGRPHEPGPRAAAGSGRVRPPQRPLGSVVPARAAAGLS